MRSGNTSLLDVAMKSLETNATLEKQNQKFTQNGMAVAKIGQNLSKLHRNLLIKPSIDNEADASLPAPIVAGTEFNLDLSKIMLPSQCGSGSLQDTIQRLCNEYNIRVNGHLTATCTPVTTLLAGQYDRNDVDCTGATQAEFVPAFYSETGDDRVIALCFSLNGETKLRVDHMKVSNRAMTCLGRGSHSTSALRAIEIPNEVAKELSVQQPAVFEQLQKNACLVVYIRYNLQPLYYGVAHGGGYESMGGMRLESTLGATRGGPVTRGVPMGAPAPASASVYSVVGQGSHVQDHSRTVSEQGTRILASVQVYLVGAMVLNTHDMTLSDTHCANIRAVMTGRAKELGDMFAQYKTFRYEDISKTINQHASKYAVSTTSDIFEHALLRLGDVRTLPAKSSFSPDSDPRYFIVKLALPRITLDVFRLTLNRSFGQGFCEYAPEYSDIYNDQMILALRIPLAELFKIMPLVLQMIDEILSTYRVKLAYQIYSGKVRPLFDKVVNTFKETLQNTGLDLYKADCIEIFFANMFGCTEDLKAASVDPCEDYIGKMTDTRFLLAISEEAARQIVAAINSTYQHTELARFVRSGVRLPRKGNIDLCEIVVFSELFFNPAFLAAFKAQVEYAMEHQPELIEKLRIQSGTQQASAAEHVASIGVKVRDFLSATPDSQQKSNLFASATHFMVTNVDPGKKRTQRLDASYQLTQAVAGIESVQTQDQNRLFKSGLKKVIKDAQRDLGYRPGPGKH